MSRRAEKSGGLAGSTLLLGLLIAAAAALTFWETRGQSLYADELTFFSSYRSWDPAVLLRPDGGHLVVTTLLAYKTLWGLFGAESYLPMRILHVVLASISGALFYQLARKRIGDYAALAPTALVLLFGSAGEIVATPFGSLAYGSIAFGLGAFLALERDDRLGDRIACLCLIGALASYSISIAFFLGAAVLIYLRGPEGRRRSAWVLAVPVGLYIVWRLWALHFGDSGETNVSLSNLGNAPSALVTELAAASAALSGLFRVPGQQGLSFDIAWGYAVGFALAGLAALRLRSGPPMSPRFWAVLVTLLSFWLLIALNLGPLRAPDASRYFYIGGLLILLIGIELAADFRLSRLELVGIGLLLAGSLVANVVALHQTAPQYRIAGRLLRADLAAVEIARDNIDPQVPVLELPDEPVVRDLQIPAADYSPPPTTSAPRPTRPKSWRGPTTRPVRPRTFSSSGSSNCRPGWRRSPRLPGAPAPVAESVTGARVASRAGCVVITPSTPGGAASVVLRLPPGGVELRAAAGPPVTIALRRYGDGFSPPLEPVAGGAVASVAIPVDSAPQPWRAAIGAGQEVEACPAPA